MDQQTTQHNPLPEAKPESSQPPRPTLIQNTQLPPSIERHARKCSICHHPEREFIEQDYLDWLSPAKIARQYNVDDSALHRHLHAVGLASKRRQNLRMVLDRILERVESAPVTGNTIIRAVKAYTCLTDDNQWVEPERRVIYVHAAPTAEAAIQ